MLEKIGRLWDDSTTRFFQSVSDVPSASCPNQDLQIHQRDQIAMGGVLDHIQMTDTPTARDVSVFGHLGDDFFLPLVQLRFNGRCHHEPGFRDADAIQIFARSGEGDLKITGVRAEERLIQTVVEHLVAHPAKAAPAFLDAMEIRQALRQDGIARAIRVTK